MKINKNSWHYKLCKKLDCIFGDNFEFIPPKTLCGYFWCFVFQVTRAIVMSCVMGGVILFFTLGPIIGAIRGDYKEAYFTIPTLIWGLVLLCIALGLLISGIKKLTRNDKDSFLSVAIGYAKAKKQKVCPIIEYTDGE